MNLSTQEQQFFHDFSALLEKYPTMDGQFSLWRVHQHHDLQEHEVLHEVSDPMLRTSTVRVINKDTLPETAFASQWLVKADGTIKTVVWCCD